MSSLALPRLRAHASLPEGRGLRAAASALLVALPCLVLLVWNLSPVLFGGMLSSTYDLLSFDYPSAAINHAAWSQGQIPFWNPYHASGAPFLADPSTGALYPLNVVLLALLSPGLGVRVGLILHFVIAYLGTYAYLRVIGTGRLAAVYAAAAYAFSAYFLARLDWITSIAIMALLPALVTTLELSARARGRAVALRWAFAAGCILAAQWLAGFSQQALYSGLFAVGYLVCRTALPALLTRPGGLGRAISEALPPVATFLGTAGALSAIQLLPALQYLLLSNRSRGYVDEVEPGGLVLVRWGRALYGIAGAEASGTYLGAAALLLALFVVIASPPALRRYARFFAGASCVVLLAAVKPPPDLVPFVRLLPGYSTVHAHYPERCLFLAIFGGAVLCGLAIHSAFDAGVPWRRRRWALGIAALLAAPLIVLPLALGYLRFAEQPRYLPFAGAALALLAAYLLVGDRLRFLRFALLASLVVDLGLNNQALHVRFGDVERRFESSATLQLVRDLSAGVPVRVAGLDMSRQLGGYDNLRAAPDLLTGNSAWVYQLYDAQGYNPLHLRRYWDFLGALNNGTGVEYHIMNVQNPASRLLRFLNVRFFVTPASDDQPGNLLIGGIRLSPQNRVWSRTLDQGVAVSQLTLISALERSQAVGQGEVVGRVTAETDEGTAEWTVRAGVETSDQNYDELAASRVMRHRKASTFGVPDRRYSAVLPLPRTARVKAIRFELLARPEAPQLAWIVDRIESPERLGAYAEARGDSNGYRVWELKSWLPYALRVPAAEVAATDDRALARMQQESFDPRQRALFVGAAPVGLPVAAPGEGQPSPTGSVDLLARDFEHVELATSGDAPAVLVLSEVHYPAWRAVVDGKPAAVNRVNYTFMGVVVPAGSHRVTLYYDDWLFDLGAALAGAALLFGAVLLARPLWPRRGQSRGGLEA